MFRLGYMSKVYFIILVVYINEFLLGSYYFTNSYLCMSLYLICSVLFLWTKRSNGIVCPEMLILLFSFIVFFYKELVMEHVQFISHLYDQFTEKQYKRGLCLNMISLFSFLLGANKSIKVVIKNNELSINNKIDIERASRFFPYITAVFILFVICTGKIPLSNHYSDSSVEFSNTFIVYISVVLVVGTLIEFLHLKKESVTNLTMLLKKINKVYLIQLVLYIVLLLVIGYRSGAIFVSLPIIICYSVLISNIRPAIFGSILLLGTIILALVGFMRIGDGLSDNGITFYESFRDFGPAYLTNTGLIAYTDTHGISGLGIGVGRLFSSVPFLGGMLAAVFPSTYSVNDESAVLATNLFQDLNNIDSGLGTSLIGDLYYSGHLLWVIVYMYVLGLLLNRCYTKIYVNRKIGIYAFVFYIWIFSQSIFLLRAEWYSYFRYVGFSWVVLFIMRFLYVKTVNKTKMWIE